MKTVQMSKIVSAFWSEQEGAIAIEYALLGALIFGAIVLSVGLLGDNVKMLYDEVSVSVRDAIS